jgi:hypothetical protein
VVVDTGRGGSSGGDGGASSSGGGSVLGGGGIGGAETCDGMLSIVLDELAKAQTCSPYVNTIQCSGKITAVDTCGCTVAANEGAGAVAASEQDAFDNWVGAGCGPHECYACPPAPPSPWYCDPTTLTCKPAYVK